MARPAEATKALTRQKSHTLGAAARQSTYASSHECDPDGEPALCRSNLTSIQRSVRMSQHKPGVR